MLEERTRLLIVDNDAHVVRSHATIAAGVGISTIEAGTVREARRALDGRVGAAIIEAVLPDRSGLDLLEEIRGAELHFPVLVTSSLNRTSLSNRASLHGALCVYKPDIGPAVRAFIDQLEQLDAQVSGYIRAAARRFATQHGLSPRQTDVVELIAIGIERGDVPAELGVTENTVKTLIRRLLARCGERGGSVESVARIILDDALYHACLAQYPRAGQP